MSIQLDKVVMSTLHEAYKNYNTQSVDVVISGTVAAGGEKFSETLTLSRGGTRADVFYVPSGGSGAGQKFLASESVVLQSLTGYAYTGTSVVKYSGNTLEVGAWLSNPTGSPAAVSTQTYSFFVVEYDAPITAL